MSSAIALLDLPASRRIAPIAFHAEQAKQRRRIWRATLICLAAAVIAGLFLSIIMLLFAPVTLGILAGLTLRAIQALGLNGPAIEAAHTLATGPNRNAALAAAATVVILPALLLPPLAWLMLRRPMLRAAATPWPATLTVRAPRTGDAEERQFGNLVGEMALAAGLPAPAIGIIDDPAPNLGVFGTGHRAAGIAATRGLLDTLDRDETQLLVAQATGAIGNGDLQVSASLLAVYRAIGLFLTTIDLPISRRARSTIVTLVAAPFGWRHDRLDQAHAVLDGQLARSGLARLLLWLPALLIVPAITLSLAINRLNIDKNAGWSALLPAALMLGGAAILFYGLIRVTLGIWTIFVLHWPLAYVWRSRRFLADATAVQLAGDPQALADALARLHATCAIPAGGERVSHLFVCQPGDRAGTSVLASLEPSYAIRLDRLRAMGAIGDTPPRGAAAATLVRARRRATTRLGLTAVLLVFCLANIRLTLFLLAAGLGGLFVLSSAAGVLLFITIINA